MNPARRITCCAIGVFAAAISLGLPAARAEPATSQPEAAADPKLDRILERLEGKGQSIKGLRCKLVYRFVEIDPVEQVTEKEGELLFARAEPNPKFLVHFTRIVAAGTVQETGEYFAFDGERVVERNDKARTIRRRQFARTGERQDLFRIGGPFPLPFGQKRADILRNFVVTLEPFTPEDPRNTDHLHCVPRPNTELADKYSRVEIYIDRKLELPVRIVTERLSDGNRTEADFREIDANEAPAGSRFSIEAPKDYDVTDEPMDSVEKPAGPAPGKDQP